MNVNLVILFTILIANKVSAMLTSRFNNRSLKFSYNELNDHSMVTSSDVFPYVVAIMKKFTYISAGALLDESWVITAADSLFLVRESKRVLRVRLGSINCKKGGVVLPIKFFEIHPYFSDTTPEYDIALIKLSRPVRLTPSLNPIRLQTRRREVTATHFIVTAWPMHSDHTSDELQQLQSMEQIRKRRMLMVTHLHPSDVEKCTEELEGMELNSTDTLMCLDPALGAEACTRDVGAPVVLNGILWGVVSSWKSEDCELDPGPSFVVLVGANDIAPWIHATTRGHRWNKSLNIRTDDRSEEYDDIA